MVFKGKFMNVEALIDSGANRCFCQREIGEVLGVPLSSCQKESVSGIGGMDDVFIHNLMIDIEHGAYKLPVEVGLGRFNFHGFSFILGQKDFFENIDILFQRRTGTLQVILP
jgi:hypothetical protein